MKKSQMANALVCLIGLTLCSSTLSGQVRWREGEEQIQRKTPAQVMSTLTELSRNAGSHFMLQLDQPLTDAVRSQLEAGGITLLDYLGDNAFFASINKARLDADKAASVAGLSRISTIPDQHKMHEDFVQGVVRGWTVIPQGLAQERAQSMGEEFKHDDEGGKNPIVAVYVKFHSDVVLNPNATQLAHQHQATVVSELFVVNALVLELPYGNIKDFAGEDAVEWIEPALPKLTDNNAENRARTGADILQSAPYGLNGAGVMAMVYDGGRVRTTHVDFQGRAAVGAGELACTPLADHSTHVAGTIAGAGVAVPNNRGMAPGAGIISYALNQNGACSLSQGFLYTDPGDLQSDYNEAINTYGADIANNSIGTNTANNGYPCSWEGDYGVTDTVIDSIVRGSLGAPFRVVWANGNERGSGNCNDPNVPVGYHKTAPPACAKNHITVGALNSNDDSMTSFSSWGPADDGRMKPDISAPGCQVGGDSGVTSCFSSSDTAYGVFCGTSMASPTVCGCSALLLQDFRAHFPDSPDFRNSTLKILLAHTAVDLGNVGPDYQFGYGSIRINAAVDYMRTANFLENSVATTGSIFRAVAVVGPSDTQLKITLAWDDVPGTPNVSPALVNDLDLKVFDSSNVQFFPWTLGGLANVTAPAVRTQRNSLDNIEQVVVNAPTPGVYRIEVAALNVPQGPQPFSLCASPHLFNCSSQGFINLDHSKYSCSSTSATLQVSDCDLNTDNGSIQTVQVSISSTSEPAGETVTLTETAPESASFTGSIPLSLSDSPGVLQIASGDTITGTYIDADDGSGHLNVSVTANSVVDCAPPIISNMQISAIGPRTGTITFDTNELANGIVHYGTSCGALTSTTTELGNHTTHTFVLSNLQIGTQYFFGVGATDVAGNSASDDNGGSCFSFTTTLVPDFYTELFDATDNDLDNRTLLFTPNGSLSYYAACGYSISTLPTDPTGGIPITTWTGTSDDGNSQLTLSGADTVKLYGISYGSLYVGTNGYITFGSGDTDYTESLADHFTKPRIAGLFNDLDAAQGGQVSWKQLGDRFVVTWLGVFHHGVTNSPNTFQIELYYDGRIQISWLTLTDTDGLAGLSQGAGLSPDFTETNLSSFLACGPLPPSASNSSITLPTSAHVNAAMIAADPNNDPLTYTIVSLPAHGSLRDLAAGTIVSTPYTLIGGANVLRYTAAPGYLGNDSFTFKANDGAFDSNIATVSATVGGVGTALFFPLDSNPGWITTGQWAFGHPTGGGGSNHDPINGYTGTNVYGYNLAGDYPNNLAQVQYLTTTAINFAGLTQTKLRFRRWLGVEQATFDHATIDISTNGTTWTNLFSNPVGTGQSISETAWSLQTYDIAAIADNQPTVYFRWGMGTTDGSVVFSGWNIDDVEILALLPATCGATIPGDVNLDGIVNGADIARFSQLLINLHGATSNEVCAEDVNVDGSINLNDIDEMVYLLLDNPVPQ
jgi:hypothetical protein